MDCPYRGDPLIKVLKCSGDDNQGAEFKDINLNDVFDELSASVEGSARICTGVIAGEYQFETRDKKDIVKKYETLEVINDKQELVDLEKLLKDAQQERDQAIADRENLRSQIEAHEKGCPLLQ